VKEDQLYKQLRERLRGDFTPLKPLEKPWKRALWIFPISLVFMVVTLAVFHLRSDYANFHPLVLFGFIFLQILACYLAFTVSLETSIPGSVKSPLLLTGIGLLGPAVFGIASWAASHVSPSPPLSDQGWKTGMACLTIIGLYGLLALMFGFFLVRSGLPFRAEAIGLLTGLGGGLTAEAAWRLHCPNTSWDHILIFHGGSVLFLLLAGLIIGFLWKRKVHRR
jgi:hypothetical protein